MVSAVLLYSVLDALCCMDKLFALARWTIALMHWPDPATTGWHQHTYIYNAPINGMPHPTVLGVGWGRVGICPFG